MFIWFVVVVVVVVVWVFFCLVLFASVFQFILYHLISGLSRIGKIGVGLGVGILGLSMWLGLLFYYARIRRSVAIPAEIRGFNPKVLTQVATLPELPPYNPNITMVARSPPVYEIPLVQFPERQPTPAFPSLLVS